METSIFTHRQTANYTVISNDILQDENMTFFTKGLFAYLLSLPSTWNINIEVIADKFGEKGNRISGAFKELIELGYCVRKPYRKDGRLRGQKYFISDIRGYFNSPDNIKKCENTDPLNLQTSEKTEGLKLQTSEITDTLKTGESIESKDNLIKEISNYNKRKKTLFFENEKLKDLDYFLSKFNTPDYEQIDMVFYYHAVGDWSYSSGTKRDENGWLATTRNFIRSDMDKGHLRTKTGVMKSTQSIKKEKEYMDILNIEKELQSL